MSKYVFFLLFCITAYFFEYTPGMWVVYLFFLGMSMVCFNSDREEKIKNEEKFKKMLVSLIVIKLQEEQLERERTFFNEMVEIKKQLDFDSSH